MRKNLGCPYCRGVLDTAVHNRPAWDQVILDFPNFVVVPTKGALLPGWLLVISKAHILCAGFLERGVLTELQAAIDHASELVRSRFGEPTLFEHGPAAEGTALGCGVDHLHIHVAPLPFSLRDAADKLGNKLHWRRIDNLGELNELSSKREAYCWVREPRDSVPYACLPPNGIRQFLRRAIASELGRPTEFDYAAHPELSVVQATLNSLLGSMNDVQTDQTNAPSP
jgi:ATP adenylyltransferase